MKSGIFYAAAAYIVWGMFPMYFKALQDMPPLQVLMHRGVWSLVFLVLVLAVRRQWGWIAGVLKQPAVLAGFAASAMLLAANWFLYIWAVNQGRVVDASLGYFITPLINVLLGFMVLRERMRPLQWSAVALATLGVAWLTWHSGHLPWVSLLLAITFGIYGLLRKTAALGALEGLSLETAIMFPVAFGFLAWWTVAGDNQFFAAPSVTQWLLLAAGPVTAIPLLMFATGARRIPLSLLGIMQYITPSLQLLLGVWLYHEPFGGDRQIGFALIWAALALYSAEGAWRAWGARPVPPV